MSSILRKVAPLGRIIPGPKGSDFAFLDDRGSLDSGTIPPTLTSTVSRLLKRADESVARGNIDTAIPALVKVFELTHHIHVRDWPERFLPLFDASSAMAALRSPIGKDSTTPRKGASRRNTSSRNLLVLAHKSFVFIDPLIENLSDRFDVSIRKVDLSEWIPDEDFHVASLIKRRLEKKLIPVPDVLKEHAEWADVIFVEWGHHALTWASVVDFGDVPLIGRMHRFEAFTPFVQLTDYSRVDKLIFVARHIERLVHTVVSQTNGLNQVDIVPNFMEAERFSEPKAGDADHSLMMVGWDRPVKDVSWALEVLHQLLHFDPSYKLLLVGSIPSNATTLVPRNLLADGNVEILGRRDDMPQVYRNAGFILSASRSEGTHESVAEGAASGAVPVVRDWPLDKRFGGATDIYPSDWIVESTTEASQRIMGLRGNERREVGDRARDWVRKSRNREHILDQYFHAIFSDDSHGEASR